jgi:hypothetical protein
VLASLVLLSMEKMTGRDGSENGGEIMEMMGDEVM